MSPVLLIPLVLLLFGGYGMRRGWGAYGWSPLGFVALAGVGCWVGGIVIAAWLAAGRRKE